MKDIVISFDSLCDKEERLKQFYYSGINEDSIAEVITIVKEYATNNNMRLVQLFYPIIEKAANDVSSKLFFIFEGNN